MIPTTTIVPEGLQRLREHANREHRDARCVTCLACQMARRAQETKP